MDLTRVKETWILTIVMIVMSADLAHGKITKSYNYYQPPSRFAYEHRYPGRPQLERPWWAQEAPTSMYYDDTWPQPSYNAYHDDVRRRRPSYGVGGNKDEARADLLSNLYPYAVESPKVKNLFNDGYYHVNA